MGLSSVKAGLRATLTRELLKRSGPIARRALHPNPFNSPARRSRIDFARDAGLGDVLMCTPALRELRRVNPRGRIRFFTNFGALIDGLPYIDEVHPFDERPDGTPFIEYTHIVPSPVHLARLIGDRMGVAVTDVRPDCVVDRTLVDRRLEAWRALPRPRVAILRRASRYTPNKDWPDASWNELVARLAGSGTVIEVGGREASHAAPPPGSYLDLRDATPLPELVAVIAAADMYVGPVSGPMHVAAAVGTPSVAIIGGFEHPVNTRQAGNVEFYTAVPCAPCWLREPCPHDLKCLKAITVDRVAAAVDDLWARTRA